MTSAIHELEQRLGKTWTAISTARATSDEILSKLENAVAYLQDPNLSVVVTGSLGRGEANNDSDADWMLLADGPSNPDHAVLARELGKRISEVVPRDVGPTGTFAGIVPSHDLIHYIAGTRDTNENLTRRILLLSESRALSNKVVRDRVIRNLLARYVVNDRSVASKSGIPHAVPHFLLNDIFRYWRTMASDYASKMWDRDRKGWGIRNVKLRFSRKLLFIWGLLASFSGKLWPTEAMSAAKNDDEYLFLLAELIREQTDVSPLELLARAVRETDDNTIADRIFSSYDHFLGVLADHDARARLESVQFTDATNDKTYDDLRESSREFRSGVTELFFDKHPQLPGLVREFGVF